MCIRRQPDICWMVAETDDSAEAPHSQYAEGYPFLNLLLEDILDELLMADVFLVGQSPSSEE